ncbi:MAG: hypothetical protein NC340_09385 [Ruminococcus flavefaciens]|nr:hypothetical protein [Ruminococcus flavefaciens]MCM1230634.1 hypothetical protein [Ruminococcus flavefaciens]
MKINGGVLLCISTACFCAVYNGIAKENDFLHYFFYANIFTGFISLVFFSRKLQNFPIIKKVRTIAEIYLFLVNVSAVVCIFVYIWLNPQILEH